MSETIYVLLSLLVIGCTSKMMDSPDAGAVARPPFTTGVSTLAGFSDAGLVDGSRDLNLFRNPVNVAYGHDGKVYVADFDNNKIRVVDATGGTTTLATPVGFARPFGMAFAADGALYVSTDNNDTNGHSLLSGTIWKLDVHTDAAAVVARAIGRPRGITVMADGRLAVADNEHQVIEIVDPGTGAVTVLAGTWDVSGFADDLGGAARFAIPYGLVQRADGSLVVCDYGNQRMRLVGLDGSVSTLAGTGTAGFADGALASAQFDHPQGISIASNGDLYVTDIDNFRVRRITAASIATGSGQIETIAGNGTGGYIDADDRLGSELYGLEGLSVAPDGSMVYVADGARGEIMPFNRVRQIKMTQ